MDKKFLMKPSEFQGVVLELTEDQKKKITKYMKETGRQVGLALHVEVVEDKIAPAAITLGAV